MPDQKFHWTQPPPRNSSKPSFDKANLVSVAGNMTVKVLCRQPESQEKEAVAATEVHAACRQVDSSLDCSKGRNSSNGVSLVAAVSVVVAGSSDSS